MQRVAIFVDGGYLDKVLKKGSRDIRIDYQKLCDYIAGCFPHDVEILRAYYYHCLPYQSSPPTPEQSERFGARQRFYDALGKLPRFEVRLGRLARRGSPDNYHYEQKMVDALLSIDLVSLSLKNKIAYAAIVTGDSDFVPAIKVARDEGVCIWLFHVERPHNDIWDIADERVELTQDTLYRLEYCK